MPHYPCDLYGSIYLGHIKISNGCASERTIECYNKLTSSNRTFQTFYCACQKDKKAGKNSWLYASFGPCIKTKTKDLFLKVDIFDFSLQVCYCTFIVTAHYQHDITLDYQNMLC